jgi:hypothetical protein
MFVSFSKATSSPYSNKDYRSSLDRAARNLLSDRYPLLAADCPLVTRYEYIDTTACLLILEICASTVATAQK